MPSNLFGTRLKDARYRTRNPETQKSLTQQGLADAIATILKTNGSPTFQTISHWERGTHQPESKDRDVLLALVAALVQYQGLLTQQTANELLQGGGYAQLSDAECVNLNLADPPEPAVPPANVDVHLPPSPPPIAPRQLRAPTTDFVGREKERADLIAALQNAAMDGSVAAISGVRGMGGIGKSELALVVAAQLGEVFPYQIELDLRGSQPEAAISTVQALQTVINAFGRLEKLPDDEHELTALYRSLLHGKRVLIFADDAKDAAQVRRLMPPPGSALLVTSRLRFRLSGMFDVDLEGLSAQEAVKLLCKTCPRLTGEQAGQIAVLCGNMPLALIISGGVLHSDDRMDIDSYTEQLHDEGLRLGHLNDPDDPELSVEASLNLSYRLLDAHTQQLLAQLGVFFGSFDANAANATLNIPDAVESDTLLGLLRRRSLLEWDDKQNRYSLHELVRVFALARLREQNEEETTRLHHAHYYIAVAAYADQQFMAGGDGTLAALALFDRERTQLDAARIWLQEHTISPETDDLLIADANATAHIGDLRYPKRGVRILQLETALQAARRRANRGAQKAFLGNLGLAYANLGEVQRAIGLYKQQLVIAHEIGDRWGQGAALGNMGSAYHRLGEGRRAIDLYEQLLVIAREIGDRHGEGAALGNLGIAYAGLGEVRRAIDLCEQQLVITREIGDRQGEGRVLGNLGLACYRLGEVERAIDLYEQLLVIAREIGDRHGEGTALGNLGLAYARLGEVEWAIELHEQHLVISREIGNRQGEGEALGSLGLAYYRLGDGRRAIDLYEQQLVITREIGDRRNEGGALSNLGLAYAGLGEVQQSVSMYEQHLVITREIGDRQGEAEACWNYGGTLVAQGETAQALRLLEAGYSFFASIGHPQAGLMVATIDHVRQHGTLPSQQHSDIPESVRAALERRDPAALQDALAMLSANERARVEQIVLEQMVAQQPPRELQQLLAALPEQVRHAFEQGDEAALQAAWQTLSPEQEQSAALALAQIRAHQQRAIQTDPRERFAPLLSNIACVASGDDTARTQIEAELAQLESNGWHLSAAVQHLWVGERDLATLTSGLDEQDTLLVEHMLELVGAYERGERQTPSQLLAALPEALREAFTQQDRAAFDAVFARLPDDEQELIAPLLTALAEGLGAAAPDTDYVPESTPVELDMVQITQSFLPTLGDIALAAHGDRIARALAEAALPRLAAAGWHLTEGVQHIWVGQRDEAVLTANIDPGSAHLVRRILALIAGGPAMIFAAGSVQIATMRQQTSAATEQALAASDAEQRAALAGALEQKVQQIEQEACEIAPWRDLATELRGMAARLRAG